jgi:hypothetical protein
VAQQRKIASRTGHAAQVTRQRPFRCRQRCSVRSSPLLRDQHAVTAADAAQLLAAPAFCLQDTAAALLQLVERRMLPALLASSDWSALVDALDAAPDAVIHARQRSRQSQQQQQQQAHQPRLPQQLPQQQQRAQHGWGFALRQPGAPRQQSAAAVNSLQLASPEAASPTWNRHSVVTLRLLGLGSIAELAPRCRAAGSNGMPPPRLGLRLAQLALATALARHALPGLTALPVAFDPACDLNGLDGALLAGLGFDAVRTEPPLAVDAADLPGGSTLLYLPCAPRQLAERVLVRGWHACCCCWWWWWCCCCCCHHECVWEMLGNDRTRTTTRHTGSSDCIDTKSQFAPGLFAAGGQPTRERGTCAVGCAGQCDELVCRLHAAAARAGGPPGSVQQR